MRRDAPPVLHHLVRVSMLLCTRSLVHYISSLLTLDRELGLDQRHLIML